MVKILVISSLRCYRIRLKAHAAQKLTKALLAGRKANLKSGSTHVGVLESSIQLKVKFIVFATAE